MSRINPGDGPNEGLDPSEGARKPGEGAEPQGEEGGGESGGRGESGGGDRGQGGGGPKGPSTSTASKGINPVQHSE